MFRFFNRKPAKTNALPANPQAIVDSVQSPSQTAAAERASYASQVIQNSLYHAIMHNTFVGSLNRDWDFGMITMPDGVAFASNIKKGVGAVQERTSTRLMFEALPVAYLAEVASPAAIEFNLRQQPKWTMSEIDEKGKIVAFKTEIVIDQSQFIATFRFTASEAKVKVSPTAEEVPGSTMTISIEVSAK
jgi:hypothetical protein